MKMLKFNDVKKFIEKRPLNPGNTDCYYPVLIGDLEEFYNKAIDLEEMVYEDMILVHGRIDKKLDNNDLGAKNENKKDG